MPETFKLRVRDGVGNHYVGDDEFKAGDEFESEKDESRRFPEKIERLIEGKVVSEAQRRPGETIDQFQERLNAIIARERTKDAPVDTLDSMTREELLRVCEEEELEHEGLNHKDLVTAIRKARNA